MWIVDGSWCDWCRCVSEGFVVGEEVEVGRPEALSTVAGGDAVRLVRARMCLIG